MITYEGERLFSFKGVMPHVDKNDKYIVLFFVVLLTALRLFLSGLDSGMTAKWPSLFRRLIVKRKLSRDKKVSKMSESVWYLIWHSFSLTYTVIVLLKDYGTAKKAGWLRYFVKDLKGIWYGLINNDAFRFFSEDIKHVRKGLASWPMLSINMETRVLLLLCTAFWISSLIFINWETRRSDMNVMKFHHVTTIVLLVLSYVYNFHRISLLVIFLHDIPDVFLYLTKVYSYIIGNNEKILFTLFTLYGTSHFMARFIFLCRFVAYPLLINFDNLKYSGGTIKYLWDFPGGVICPLSIVVLTVMNAYWFKLILTMFKNVVLNRSEIVDTREED